MLVQEPGVRNKILEVETGDGRIYPGLCVEVSQDIGHFHVWPILRLFGTERQDKYQRDSKQELPGSNKGMGGYILGSSSSGRPLF